MKNKDMEFANACTLVENFARTLGKDCQIIFADDGVEVAPLSWAGSTVEKTLYQSLTEARKHID
jgi:hypothetical protein